MEEEEDDIYDPEESLQVNAPQSGNTRAGTSITGTAVKDERMEDDLEEGEEEEEADDSDSDIDIITDRKDGSKPEPPAQPSRYSTIKNIPARTASASAEPSSKNQQIKSETPRKGTPPKSGADYPAISTSTIDVNAKPVFDPAGKLITELDMDNDFGENDKPWRRPGSDITDYFNYGFDEFTWASYCLKQNTLRKEVQDEKKQLEDMMTMGMPGAMPGMPPMPGAMGMPSMPGMPDMPPEMMQQMMAQFMPQGANMDPSMFMQQMQQEMSNQPGANSGNQGPAYGGGPGFGSQSQNQQGMNYGFDNRGGYAGGRGRGGNRRNW